MSMDFEVNEALLHGYADGKLTDTERVMVERYLARHPDKAAEVANWQRQNEALQALFAPVAGEPVPARLDPHQIARQRAGNSNFRWPQLAAAAVVLVALGASIGWFGRDAVRPAEPASEILVDSAVTAHALFVKEKRHAVEVAASEKDHLVSWLSSRIARPIDTPDLTSEGFALVGGRLLPASAYTQAGPAAQLMYENAAAERVTVYITAALPDGGTAYEFTSRNALDAVYWANDAITCTVVGDLPEAQMRMVARKVYQQLTRLPDVNYRAL
ncbi:MAG: anti-sigma factor [Devosia sp.]|nr:anti-sigma factor [Devosia sp.]